MQETERINWLSVLRGMTILLVVMNHVRLVDASTGQCYQCILDFNHWFLPLRIPTFIMVSGALLYYSRITRGWKTMALYRDKLMRLGMPLIFCTLLGNIMQIMFNSFVKNPIDMSPEMFMRSFILIDGQPWPHRWYLMTLAVIMAMYPLFVMKKSKMVDSLVLVALLVLQVFDFTGLWSENWFYLLSLNKYLPYFYLGIVAFRYRWYRYLDSWKVAVVLTVLYAVTYIVGIVHIPEAFTDCFPIYKLLGAAMIVAWSIQIDRLRPSAFNSFSGYIFQIYLYGIAFQAFVELILWRSIGAPAYLLLPVYILNVAVGIYAPVAMSKVVEHIPYQWVRLCFGLK